MSPTKLRVRFENVSDTALDGKTSREEVTADSESESDEVVFGVVKNLYVPKSDDELGTIGSMFNNDEDKKKKKSLRGVVIGMANLFLTKQILKPRMLLKNDVNDRNGGKLGQQSQRRGAGSKASTGTMLLNADAWRNPNPMINLDLCHNAFASRPKNNKSKIIRKAAPKTHTEMFTTPSRQDLSSPNKINNSDTSRNSIGSTMSISTASLSPQSSVTSKGTSRLNVNSISPGIVPTQCNLNISNHGYNLSMSSSDNEDDDYSVDEDVEDIVSVAMSNQYQPNRGFRSSCEEEEIDTYYPNNKLNKRRSVTRVKTNTPTKYMMYQFDTNDQSHTNGMKHKSI